ncbi:hypothetical protein JRO89_XS03G0307500 [Xanthoceras sorbifolium]|uniref:Uncharacterized protein n=1 Tax=Xanthoceras sorbifolium TaxID=99658 RepID=A0ABQ8ID08_9ROSI|nr:hypothetical protein JRO89_XS03G0307500 [Xanthoceras sorbifolium]
MDDNTFGFPEMLEETVNYNFTEGTSDAEEDVLQILQKIIISLFIFEQECVGKESCSIEDSEEKLEKEARTRITGFNPVQNKMQIFTTKIVNMCREAKLFASPRGRIILACSGSYTEFLLCF